KRPDLTGKAAASEAVAGEASRRVALDAIIRINEKGAYANLVLSELLDRSGLGGEDRRFVTELVYGSTRMRRACAYLADRFVIGDVDPEVRAALQIGAYQLAFLNTPPHAAVSATVGAVRSRGRSLVNAVLRKVASAPIQYPDLATELSYPDWLMNRVSDFLGPVRAEKALREMNRPAETAVRDDGYIQDPASQMVIDVVAAQPGDVVVDLCAAPGGKATGMAATGVLVIAADRRRSRARLIAANSERLGRPIPILVADGRQPAIRPGMVDKVLVDAPCSGLGSLRRRPDARWRIEPEAASRLAELQLELLVAGYDLLKPGGELTYSVCTLDRAEGPDVVEGLRRVRPDVRFKEPPGSPWEIIESMAVLVPSDHDGMMLAQMVKPT
ncbi:MAG: hypothetical protein OER95_17985, partial [Acidimicrobiia bacterium]|nr:hypothetical protein [Acidimicrobiia bacterium]